MDARLIAEVERNQSNHIARSLSAFLQEFEPTYVWRHSAKCVRFRTIPALSRLGESPEFHVGHEFEGKRPTSRALERKKSNLMALKCVDLFDPIGPKWSRIGRFARSGAAIAGKLMISKWKVLNSRLRPPMSATPKLPDAKK